MRRCLICLPLLLVLSGCQALPFARELEATMLVQVLGVDWSEESVALTAASDPREGSGDAAASILSASGETLEQAKAALIGAGEEYVSLTHVAQLVVGEGTCLRTVLEAALAEPALGQGATVWVAVSATAQELLEAVEGGAKRLSSIQLNAGIEPVTVLQALMRLEEDGQVMLPSLTVAGETLEPSGHALITEGEHGE